MTAETLTGTRGSSTFPVSGPSAAGVMQVFHGGYSIPANVEDGDIFELFKVPKDFVLLEGWVRADDADSATNEALDMDLGWAASADGLESASAAGLGNFGVWVGDAVTGVKPEVGVHFAIGGVLFTAGPKKFAAEVMIQLEANAAATTFAAGHVYVTLVGVIDPNWSL